MRKAALCRVSLLAGLILLCGLSRAAPMAYFVTPGGTLVTIDTATNALVGAPLAIGANPYAAVPNPAGTRVYVSVFGANTVAVVDTATNTVVATIPVAAGPQGLAVSPTGARVFVASFTAGAVTVIDAATNAVVTSVPVAGAVDVAVNSTGTRVYVAAGNAVPVIDAVTNTLIGTLPSSGLAAYGSLALGPSDSRLYAWADGSFKIAVYDVPGNAYLTAIPIATTTFANDGIAVHPSGSPVYHSTGAAVSFVNPATNTVSGIVPLSGTSSAANGVAVTPDGSRVYAATASGVRTFDTATNMVTTLPTGSVRSMGKFIGGAVNGCAGFTDVGAASIFCPNVEWLRNRAITLGCSSSTLYCPSDPVTRVAMAAFMNRLGRALSPETLFRETGTGAITIPDAGPGIAGCQTIDSTLATYPRTALVNGSFSGLSDTNAVAWRAFLMFSTDGGLSWQRTLTSIGLRASSGPTQWSQTDPNGVFAMEPGLAYRFAIGLFRDDQIAGTTGNFADYRCLLTATIVNRNGVVSPFDQPRPALAGGM